MEKIRKMFKTQDHSVNSSFLPLLEMKIAKTGGKKKLFLFLEWLESILKSIRISRVSSVNA